MRTFPRSLLVPLLALSHLAACDGGTPGECTDACTIGETECRGDATALCVRGADGCTLFAEPESCRAGESCSLGMCSTECVDECETGETRCSGTDASQRCGDGDSDTCLDWLTPDSCATPPRPTCVDSTTLRTFSGAGTCGGDGTCSFTSSDSTCDSGCADGRCVGTCTAGWTTTQTANPSPPSASSVHSTVFDGRCGAAVGQIFSPDAPFNQSVRDTCVDPDSDAIVSYLEAVVDGSQTFRIDMGASDEPYGFHLLAADDSVTHVPFSPTDDFFDTSCDRARIPVPADGRLEGEMSYQCDGDGDCHLLVFDTAECELFEMWRADDPLGSFPGGCLAVWTQADATSTDLRGLSCTSADAAGLPIMPLLVTPDEMMRGQINHALRFILPNEAVQRDVYVRPATHNPLTVSRFGDPAAGPSGTMPPPYGVRLRLRADFDTSGLSPGARMMAEALKEYGMFHADGGNVTFIASNENFSAYSWSDAAIDLGPNDLRDAGLSWTDFEVVSDLSDTGSMSATDCSRTPLSEF